MMKLLADILSPEMIADCPADGIIVSDADFSCFPEPTFTYEEVNEVASLCRKHGKMIVLNIDAIIGEEELPLLIEKLDAYLALGIDYYLFGDFAVYGHFREKGEKGLIFDSKTLITNKEDALIYKDLGIMIAISNEISLEEILEVASAGNCLFDIYGHRQIFYSKRPLLGNYFKNAGLTGDEKLFYELQEEKRPEKYPIHQTKRGTFIYTPYRYALFKELSLLKDKLLFGRINTAFLSEDEAMKIIGLYKKALAGDCMDTLYEKLLAINPNVGRGFLDKKSILLKEEA